MTQGFFPVSVASLFRKKAALLVSAIAGGVECEIAPCCWCEFSACFLGFETMLLPPLD